MLLSFLSRVGKMKSPAVSDLNSTLSVAVAGMNHIVCSSTPDMPSRSYNAYLKGRSGWNRMSRKHWNPKWKKLRALKVMKIKLPDFREEEKTNKLTPEEIRSEMKKRGFHPPTPWAERQFEISCTSDVFEPYVPPEGDGKASMIYDAAMRAKQTAIHVGKKSKSMMAVRKIRTFDEDFDSHDFAKEAESIYIKMHEAMISQDRHALRLLVTEKAYPEIWYNLKLKTLRWQLLETVEPPRVSYARCVELIAKENVFAQLTCRFHTKQTLAIYDRFGRLMFGNELTPKDVLEYVVFEKHLANQYGTWRVHGKIIPDWKGVGFDFEPKRTIMVEKEKHIEEKDEKTDVQQKELTTKQ